MQRDEHFRSSEADDDLVATRGGALLTDGGGCGRPPPISTADTDSKRLNVSPCSSRPGSMAAAALCSSGATSSHTAGGEPSVGGNPRPAPVAIMLQLRPPAVTRLAAGRAAACAGQVTRCSEMKPD